MLPAAPQLSMSQCSDEVWAMCLEVLESKSQEQQNSRDRAQSRTQTHVKAARRHSTMGQELPAGMVVGMQPITDGSGGGNDIIRLC